MAGKPIPKIEIVQSCSGSRVYEQVSEMKRCGWAWLLAGLFVVGMTVSQLPRLQQEDWHSSTPSVLAKPPTSTQAQDVGDHRSFWVYDFDEEFYYQVTAHLLAIGEHCCVYFEDHVITMIGEGTATDRAENYQGEFDSNIYARVTELAGNPNGTLGDIDGDPRVVILVILDVWSYYSQNNEGGNAHSNMCEMVYISHSAYDIVGTIAHEFHHLVWFNYEFDEMHFILEGAAEYATYYAGYLPSHNRSSRAEYFLNDIHDSLIYFEVEAQDYGACYLFAFYLAEQYGVQFLRDIVQCEGDGAAGLESALSDAGHNITFNELYLDWMTALVIDDTDFSGGRYGLKNMDATVSDCIAVNLLPYHHAAVPMYRYGSRVFRINAPPDSLTVDMSSPPGGVAGLSVAYHDEEGWHVKQAQSFPTAHLNISGVDVTDAFVICSYLMDVTPAGEIDFGSGPEKTAAITIQRTNSTETETGTGLQDLIVVGTILSSSACAVVALVLLYQERKR
jgi:hypothetical protein